MMSKGKSTFRKNDIRRLAAAAKSEGIKIGAIEVDRSGTLRLIPGGAEDSAKASTDPVALWDAAVKS